MARTRPPTEPELAAIPPEVAAAEDRIAGDVVNGHAALVLEHVQPKWLYSVRHRRILERAQAIISEGDEVDLVTLCEGQDRDAVLFASNIIDASLGGSNIPGMARILERDWRRREAIGIGRELADNSDPEHAATLSARLAAMLDTDSDSGRRIASRAISGLDLMSRDIPPLGAMLGRGLIVDGGLTLVVGHSGLGKTFLALQLMRAVAQGSEWLDTYWTDPDGRRVGLLELEMPESSIKARVAPIAGEWLRATSFLCMPDFPVDLTQRETQDEIIAWVRSQRIDMLIMDPANRLHGLDENKATDMALFMAGCHRVRAKTGVSLVVLHHVTKTIQDLKTAEATPRTMVLQMVRGSGRLGNDPDTIIGLLEAPGNRVKLVFAKTRHAETPSEIHLRRIESGYFELSEAVQVAKANESDEKIEKYLLTRHTPATVAEIAKGVRMSERGAKKRLDAMDDKVESSESRPRRYSLRTSALADQCDFVTSDVATGSVNDF